MDTVTIPYEQYRAARDEAVQEVAKLRARVEALVDRIDRYMALVMATAEFLNEYERDGLVNVNATMRMREALCDLGEG